MPIRQGDSEAKNLSTCPRLTWRRISTSPVALMPCTWKTDLAMSRPMVVTVLMGCSWAPGCSKQPCYLTAGWEPSTASLALSAIRRVLKPDGFVILTCPDLQTIGERLASGDI